MTKQSRIDAGVPAGGQYAAHRHAEPASTLAASARPANGMPALGSAATDTLDEAGNLVKQVRLVNGKPDDAPDGTAAVIIYSSKATGYTREVFYTDGVLHDGSGDKPTERMTWPSGASDVTRGFRRPYHGHIVPQDSADGQPGSVRTGGDGTVTTTHYANGTMQDPAPGVPAKVQESPDGSRWVTHAPFGRISDLADGTPAERRYYPDGTLKLEWRQFDGWTWDGDDGQPAERHFHPDGSVAKELHVFKGKLLDPAKDVPALVEYALDGTVVRTESRPWIDTWDSYISHANRPTRRQANYWAGTEPAQRYVPEAPAATRKAEQ